MADDLKESCRLSREMCIRDSLYDAVVAGKPVKRGSVNHTAAGCRFFLENYHSTGQLDMPAIVAELLAYACGGHHGLFDCIDAKNGFLCRLLDEKIEYESVKGNFLPDFAQDNDALFSQSLKEIEVIVGKINAMCEGLSLIHIWSRSLMPSSGL